MSVEIAAEVQEFLTNSQNIADQSQLSDALIATSAQFGVEQVAFVEFRKIGDLLVPVNARGSLPLEFGEQYIQENIFKIDPFMKKASKSDVPFTWDEGIEPSRDSEETQRFIAACRKFGMTDGLFFPLHTADGVNCWTGFVGTIHSDIKSRGYLQQLALYYSIAMIRIIRLEDDPVPIRVLTDRQLECIKWIAEGKSDWEIATILGLSQATVNRHVERAKERFGVSTRTQVLVKAVQSGELVLNPSQDYITGSILSRDKIKIKFA